RLDVGGRYKLYPYPGEDGKLNIGLCSGSRTATPDEVVQAGGTPSATESPPNTSAPPLTSTTTTARPSVSTPATVTSVAPPKEVAAPPSTTTEATDTVAASVLQRPASELVVIHDEHT